MPSLEIPHELTVCVIVTDGTRLGRLLAALGEQSAPKASYDVVLVDATQSGVADSTGAVEAEELSISALRQDPGASRESLLNAAWTAASAPGVAFLAEDLVPSFLWVEALQRALRRGRRLVSGHLLPQPDQVGGSGALSMPLWASARELSLVTADHLACLRADLERVGGWPEDAGDDGPGWGDGDIDALVADTSLGARLVDAGVDPFHARHAVAYEDVSGFSPAQLADRRRRAAAIAAVLDEHPRARARLLVAGTFWRPRHVEALLLLAAAALSAQDRRWAWLATPWVHERTCLAPRAGGPRRRWAVLPGVLAIDLHDTVVTTALRLRPRRPR